MNIVRRPEFTARKTDPSLSEPSYIPDLDGLRAVAVVGVLLFHLGIRQIGGGFIGVDVFYVISGYIIFKLIWLQKCDGTFSYIAFYTRRARRLIPSLLAVLAVTFAVSFCLLSPKHFEEFAKSAIYSAISAANVNFWLGVSYFDSGKLTKPLLHTWSLAVEEQFYLFWPLFVSVIFVLRRHYKWVPFVAIVFVGVISFAFMIGMQDAHPSAVFYLTPFRVWQFCGGAVIAMALTPIVGSPLKTIACIAGIATILFGYLYVSEISYPGLQSIIPTVGAMLALVGMGSRTSKLLLGNAVGVWFGRRSYALYLVHWPLLVLYHYTTQRDFTGTEVLALGIGSIALAELLHRFVEQPFRRPWTNLPAKEPLGVAAGLLTCSAVAIILSAHVWAQSGWDWRLSPNVDRLVRRMSYDPAPPFQCRRVNLP